jgi:hypothetical protein
MAASTIVQSSGEISTVTGVNSTRNKKRIAWMGDYDGNMADINLFVNDNGSKENINIQLDNEDILALLAIPSENVPVDIRLAQDFNMGSKKRVSKKTPRSKKVSTKKKPAAKGKSKKTKGTRKKRLICKHV